MKKLLALLFVFTTMGLMVSCDDDDDPIDDVNPDPTQEELQEAAIEAAQTAVDAVASSDDTATGASDETVFDDWTLFANADVTAGRVKAVAPVEKKIEADITEDMTWDGNGVGEEDADTIFVLEKRVIVKNGATLTITPGTIIKGNAELSGANAAVLMIAKGAKLMAEGTAEAPIIMTSTDDDIVPGALAGTSLDEGDNGKWGGLVILGKAPVSAKTEDPQIEGVDASITEGQYGGDDADDNSGSIKYVSIRHGGAEIAEGSEINGLTLGGVGSGTTIEYIEIYANKDDGVEFFGGTVDLTNLIVYNVGDDGIDVDQSYAGTVKNFAVYVGDSDEGLEIDGREGSLDDSFTITDGVIYSIEGSGKSTDADFKSKAKGTVTNVVFKDGKVKLSASFDTETYEESEDAASNVVDGSLKFSKVSASSFEVYTKSFDE